jgi:hypothetical protein
MDKFTGKVVLNFAICTKASFVPFSVVECINIDVLGSFQVMAVGFYTFERLEYQISLSYSKNTPPPP